MIVSLYVPVLPVINNVSVTSKAVVLMLEYLTFPEIYKNN